ncbi:glycosyltransferase, partial [Thomasclavelia cocleata]
CWYFVGEGSQRNYLEGCILENDLQNNVILLGLKTNPYPYIKNCDIYVQPSRYEGYCTTTNEARVLAKPIITTNVFGADEQFINQLNGIIVDFSEKEITNAIIDLIIDNEKRTLFVNELKKIDFNYDKQLNYLPIFDD